MQREGTKRKVICVECGCTEFKVDFPTDPHEQNIERSHRLGLTVRAVCVKCGNEIEFTPLRSTQVEISKGAALRERTTVTEGA